ncbi:potassium-transporting ATPase subunit F [Planococcus sp. MSAK28401]
MSLLLITVAAVSIYLLYVLINPEKF